MSGHYEIIGIIAGILAIGGYIPYIISIIRGTTKPNRATWFIWTVVGGLLAFSYMAEGDQNSIWLPLGYFFGPLIAALLSLKYGYAHWTRLDTYCITAALLSIIPWILLEDATATLIINVAIDIFGALPTVVKTYYEPETEDLTAWSIFLVANTLQLFAISMWNIAAIYPIYLFILASTLVLFIVKGKLTPSARISKDESTS
jgi:uncharacterized protein with PQ loop repeat